MNIDRDGRSELHYAALEGNGPLVRKILHAGHDVNIQCKQGWTPLHYAAQEIALDAAKELISAGANIELKDIHGNSPLWRAVMASRGDGSIIQLLLSAGANPDAENASGVSPRSLANSISNYNIAIFFEVRP